MTKVDITLTPEQFEAKKLELIAEGFVINGTSGTIDKSGVVVDYVWKSPVLKFQLTGRGILGGAKEKYAAALIRKWFGVSSTE